MDKKGESEKVLPGLQFENVKLREKPPLLELGLYDDVNLSKSELRNLLTPIHLWQTQNIIRYANIVLLHPLKFQEEYPLEQMLDSNLWLESDRHDSSIGETKTNVQTLQAYSNLVGYAPTHHIFLL